MGCNKNRAFTLIELLVVIAIVGLLMAVIIPALSKAKTAAEEIICKNNLRQYGLASELYLTESDGRFPSAWQSLYDSCQGQCPNLCQNSSHDTFTGELQRFCRWHNPDYNLEAHPEYAGPYWPYLAVTQASICPTFKRLAKRYGQFHPSHNPANDRVEVQFSYSMNSMFLRQDSGGTYYTLKKTQVASPAQTFIWAEENMWLLNDLSDWVLNDNALHASADPANPIDCFGSFHKISMAQLNIQQNTHEYEMGTSNVLMLDGTMHVLTPPETYLYRGHPK